MIEWIVIAVLLVLIGFTALLICALILDKWFEVVERTYDSQDPYYD